MYESFECVAGTGLMFGVESSFGAGVDAAALDVGVDVARPSGARAHAPLSDGAGEGLVIILPILQERQPELLHVGGAGRLPGLFSCLSEDGKKYRGEDGYYRDHDEQFDEGEGAASLREALLPGRDRRGSGGRWERIQ
jgi:hypothetical protein